MRSEQDIIAMKALMILLTLLLQKHPLHQNRKASRELQKKT